jgi:hypothetical protein
LAGSTVPLCRIGVKCGEVGAEFCHYSPRVLGRPLMSWQPGSIRRDRLICYVSSSLGQLIRFLYSVSQVNSIQFIESISSFMQRVASRPRFNYYSPLPTVAYWGLVGPTMMTVSVWLSASSRLSACYCLGRHCVLRSLVTPR